MNMHINFPPLATNLVPRLIDFLEDRIDDNVELYSEKDSSCSTRASHITSCLSRARTG